MTQVAPGTADIWARTVTQGFYGRDDVPDEALEIATVNTHTADTACFLAWAGEEPAGGGAVSLRRGVATFFSTSTRPAFRGQGVQTALIRARLAHAAAAGCDLAMVRTTPGSGSQRNVERAGFGVVYTKGVLARG